MKFTHISLLSAGRSLLVGLLLLLSTATYADNVMTKQADGTYIVNTTTICNAKGFRKATPLEVYIKDGKVTKIVALKNEESKPYFSRIIKSLFPAYEGLKVSKAKKLASQTKVDGCTGATFSFKAVQQNIDAALKYYNAHK